MAGLVKLPADRMTVCALVVSRIHTHSLCAHSGELVLLRREVTWCIQCAGYYYGAWRQSILWWCVLCNDSLPS